jgi:hypothetical protein
METIKRKLTCRLSLKELREKGEQLSARTIEWMHNEQAKKDSAKEFGDRSKKLQGVMEELAKQVHSGVEERDVDCTWTPSPATETMRFIRQDTGQEISSRPMTREERDLYRQVPLPFSQPQPAELPALPPPPKPAEPIIPPAPPSYLQLDPHNALAPDAPHVAGLLGAGPEAEADEEHEPSITNLRPPRPEAEEEDIIDAEFEVMSASEAPKAQASTLANVVNGLVAAATSSANTFVVGGTEIEAKPVQLVPAPKEEQPAPTVSRKSPRKPKPAA